MAFAETASESLYTRVDSLNEHELDALPHGAIQLDSVGTVLKFNLYESKLSHLPKQSVIGKNFFTQVAPCTDVKEFRGRFIRGVKEKNLHEKFRYHFAFKQKPRDVTVTLYYSQRNDTVWVFVQPIEG